MELRGNVALVTGAGSGIGRSTALAFARAGCDVVLVGRRPEPLDAVADEIAAIGTRALAVPADAGRFADLRRVAERARDLGPVAYLVNSAVSSETGPFAEVDPEQLWYGMDVSLTGPLVLTRLLMPDLVDQQGAVVMVGSTVFVGWPWAAAYSAAKAGMDAFAYALRRELGPNGMHVAAVHPGGTPARKRDGFRAALAGSDDRFAALRPAGAPAARQR